MTILALLGMKALWMLMVWLGSCIVASYLSDRKGYGEKFGLATALLLTFVGAIIWVLVPPKAGSDWKTYGPFGSTRRT